MARVALASRAADELRALDPPVRQRVIEALRALGEEAANLDVKPLRGAKPWRRLRVGDYRVLFRPAEPDAFLVARIVHRSDLERAVGKL